MLADPGEFRLKTKKEKEREKKERQKLAKKEAAAKKTLKKTPTPKAVKEDEPMEEEIAPAANGKKKKINPAVAALREAMLARKAAEEEEKRLEELEEQRIEQERLNLIEADRLRQETKEKKKEREKLKIQELKKAGKYLTPAQKQAQQQAKLKLDALLAAGNVQIEGLASEQAGDKPKKVVYTKKKKHVVVPTAKSVEQVVQDLAEDDVKDSWDASSDDGDNAGADNWDGDEQAKPQQPAPVVASIAPVPKPSALKKAPAAKVKEPVDSGEESESEESDGSDDKDDQDQSNAQRLAAQRKEESALRRKERVAAAMAARSKDDMRSPICCILGHVDTGKTKLLDKIRQTNVQEGEAGGITQQIGATFFPIEAVIEKTKMLRDEDEPHEYKLPGMLVIDTPGHESFSNLRTRGSSLCNIAVLVVDIVHGLEPQTIESLNLLKSRKTPFIVALNKIDRLFDWQSNPNFPTQTTLAKQKKHVIKEFNERVSRTILEFAEQGLNACLYWDNKNLGKNVSLVPTSAMTGEGIPDLLHLLVDLTQSRMTERLMYLSELECTVLEVKVVEGLGTTIDVVLCNGVLHEGDRIVVCGLNGPIVTTIRALLTPQPMRELRVKSAYVHHKQVKASLGIKISAPDLEKAVAGARLLVVGPEDDIEDLKDEVMGDLQNLLTSIDKSGKGVCVQASTLGSLEALLSFLSDSKIPVSGINIGPVHKKDIIKASVMLERAPEYAQILAFDVPIEKEAQELAREMGVRIFSADIIYHLFDKYTAYMKDLEDEKRKELTPQAVFPCLLRMVPDAIFNKRSPIIIGVDVIEGTLKMGTPICVVSKEVLTLYIDESSSWSGQSRWP